MERGASASGAAASLRRLAAAAEGFAAQLQCAICLCAYASPASLPCNHCFCEECIHRALELKPVCPICKAPAKKRKLRYDSMIQQLLRATEMLHAPVERVAADGSKAGGQEAKTEDDESEALLLLEDKPLPSSATPTVSRNGTGWNLNGAPESPKSAKRKQNGHTHIASESAENGDGAKLPKRAAAAERVANGFVSRKGSNTVDVVDRAKAIDEIVPESIASATNDSESTQTKAARPTLRQGAWCSLSPPFASIRPADTAAGDEAEAAKKASASTTAPETKASATSSKVPAKAKGASASAANAAEPAEPSAVLSEQYPLNGPFAKDECVAVASRTWRGINKSGGAARISKVNPDGTYNVKYILESRTENNIPDYYITKPKDGLAADVTPSRAVKQRQRRSTTSYTTGSTPSSEEKTPSSSASAHSKAGSKKVSGKRKRSEMVFLCSGYDEKRTREIEKWSETLNAEIVPNWSNRVTHLIVKCVAGDQTSASDENSEAAARTTGRAEGTSGKRELFSESRPVKRWVKIRSMKYLKALVGGRWIVSEEWLQACAAHGGHVSETDFEADGHLKGRNIDDAVRRSRKRRQESLQTSPAGVNPATIGTQLFEGFCFHLVGEFLPPMPPQSELDTLLSIGGARRIRSLGDIAKEMAREENGHRQLVIVSDRINPVGLRDMAKSLRSLPQIKAVPDVAIVNYQWVLNSISEAKLRLLK